MKTLPGLAFMGVADAIPRLFAGPGFQTKRRNERQNVKINPVGSNQTELEKDNGVIVLFSYKTPVAAFVPGKGALTTNKHYSRTTSKHIGLAVKRWGATKTEVDQGVIDQYSA